MKKLVLMFVLIYLNTSLSQWNQFNSPVNDPSAFYFKDSLSGLLMGYGYPYKTTDGGISWFTPQTQISFLDAKLYFTNNNVGFAYRYSIRKTTNMGESWKEVTPDGYHTFFDMCFINDSTGYIVGDKGEIFMTHDQGLNWVDVSYQKGDNIYLYSVYFSDQNNGWISGNGFRLITSDCGKEWIKEYSIYDIRKICFLDSHNGYALNAGRGQLLKTTNGGMDWSEVTMPHQLYSGELTSLYIIDNKLGFVSGGIAENNYLFGCIYKTSDGGNTWKVIYKSNVPSEVYEIFFYNENCGWAISSLGLLHTINGGITSVEKNIRDDYELYVNYPNPFNSSTTIKYSIEKPSYVKIVVYDLLGREVKTIVNEYKNAGIYNVLFDASILSSGFYYYRLIYENNVKTKSMVLLK